MYGIGAPDNRNAGAAVLGIRGSLVKRFSEVYPVLDRGVLVLVRESATAVQYGSQLVLTDVVRGDVANFGLDHLADFLLQRKTRQHLLDPGFDVIGEYRLGSQNSQQQTKDRRPQPGNGLPFPQTHHRKSLLSGKGELETPGGWGFQLPGVPVKDLYCQLYPNRRP